MERWCLISKKFSCDIIPTHRHTNRPRTPPHTCHVHSSIYSNTSKAFLVNTVDHSVFGLSQISTPLTDQWAHQTIWKQTYGTSGCTWGSRTTIPSQSGKKRNKRERNVVFSDVEQWCMNRNQLQKQRKQLTVKIANADKLRQNTFANVSKSMSFAQFSTQKSLKTEQ